MGKIIRTIAMKNRMLYKVDFDAVPDDGKDDEDEYYEEIIYYDGGGVEGHGNSEKN